MKLRTWLVIGWSLSMVTGIVVACGGTSDEGGKGGVADSGPDVAVDTGAKPQDSGGKADVVDTGTCDTSKSFLDTISPDAAIDDAGRTAGECTACLKAKCSAEVSACNADCECQGAAGDILDCVTKGGNLLTCVQNASVSTGTLQNVVAPLGLCVQGKCKSECIPSSLQDASFGPG
ncbi:MAG: hypothetical protein JNL38_31045 [Myxococcales bacterium]|jgi:hypothetical protein|nr:hypothetical protein [Myxococcales bacterium]